MLAGLFMVSLSMFLKLVQLRYFGLGPGQEQAVNYIPLTLGYGLGFAGVYLNLGRAVIYVPPFNDLEYLLMKGY